MDKNVEKILQYCNDINDAHKAFKCSFDEFKANSVYRNAVSFCEIKISEYSNHLPEIKKGMFYSLAEINVEDINQLWELSKVDEIIDFCNNYSIDAIDDNLPVEYAVTTSGLTKKYNGFLANDSVDIHVEKGSIYGLIGRNGAGKTTLMRMLLGLTIPTSGDFEVLGYNAKNLSKISKKIGFIIETPTFYDNMTAYQNLYIRAKLIDLKDYDKKIKEVLNVVGLGDCAKMKVKKLSLGMRQKLGIASAILGEPELLILDEPTNGLDPIVIVEIRKILQNLATKGTTIIISSHILGEMSKLATSYGFIVDGKLVREISTRDLARESIDLERVFVEMVGGEE